MVKVRWYSKKREPWVELAKWYITNLTWKNC